MAAWSMLYMPLLTLLLICYQATISVQSKLRPSGFYSGQSQAEVLQWAVKLDTSAEPWRAEANAVAAGLGLYNEGYIPGSKNVFLFTHHLHRKHAGEKTLLHSQKHPNLSNNHWSSRLVNHSIWIDWRETFHAKLEAHPQVVWYMQQVLRLRKSRSLTFNDPEYAKQWHLHNGRHFHIDLQVSKAWERNITGTGVTTAVLDDGLEWTHPDLQDNYCAKCSYDLNDNDPDPSPSRKKDTNHHGTRCAGEIAAIANNSICGVGIAYDAFIAGLRILGGPMTDSLEASAFTTNMELIDVYSCSWGPDDDGETVDGPHYLAEHAMREAVTFGRKGYGNIFVVASGNGGMNNDNCNFDGYATSIYTVTIGAVDEAGSMPYYAEECACMLAVTFSSGGYGLPSIVTTDWYAFEGTGCTDGHSGTSAAAPLAAGMVALMLQVQPCLTWRDIQHIIVISAVKVDIDPGHWQQNAAGLHHSHKHGFGLMNAWRLVNAAKIWEPVPWLTTFISEELHPNTDIPPNNQPLILTYSVTAEKLDGYNLYSLEYVHVKLTLTHQQRGLLQIQLACPSGTTSMLAATRSKDKSKDGFKGWAFSTVRCWGEAPQGEWKLTVLDTGHNAYSQGQLVKWQLRLFGSPMTPAEFKKRKKQVAESADGKYLHDNITTKCYPPPVHQKPVKILSEKVLKILTLTSAFCLVMAIYETLEYIFCYEDEKKAHRRWMRQQARENNPEQETELGADEETELLMSDVLAQATGRCSAQDSMAQGPALHNLKRETPTIPDHLNHNENNFDEEGAQCNNHMSEQPLDNKANQYTESHASSDTQTSDSNRTNPDGDLQHHAKSQPAKKRGSSKTVNNQGNILMHVPQPPQYVAMEMFDNSDEEDDVLFSVHQHLLPNR